MSSRRTTQVNLNDSDNGHRDNTWREALAAVLSKHDNVLDLSAVSPTAMQDMLLQTYADDGPVLTVNAFVEALQDVYGLDDEQCGRAIWDHWMQRMVSVNDDDDNNNDDDDDDDGTDKPEAAPIDDDGSKGEEDAETPSDDELIGEGEEDAETPSDDELIGEGECELCERLIFLTRHHLIPRSTWPRLEGKLMQAAEVLSEEAGKEAGKNNSEKADNVLGEEFVHLREALRVAATPAAASDSTKKKKPTPGAKTLSLASQQRTAVRNALQQTCLICRPCHSNVHNTHDNLTLAWHYNTTDKLLECNAIYKHARWAHKQKVSGRSGGKNQFHTKK